MSLAAWMPSSLRFFSICLLRAMAARSSADEAQPMAMARTAWLATRGSAVPLACSRPVVAQSRAAARGRSLAHAWNAQGAGGGRRAGTSERELVGGAAAWARERMRDRAGASRRLHCARSNCRSAGHPMPPWHLHPTSALFVRLAVFILTHLIWAYPYARMSNAITYDMDTKDS